MAATYKQNANLFEFIAANFPDIVSAAIDAKGYALTPEDVAATATKQAATANRPKVHKPSAETKRNRAICDDILAEFNARNGEFTAAEVANMTTDPDGIPMTTRKVAALLSQMVKRGELARQVRTMVCRGTSSRPSPRARSRRPRTEPTSNTPRGPNRRSALFLAY